MKSAKYFLFSLIVIVAANNAWACWDPWYSPYGYRMYRVYEAQPNTNSELIGHYPGSKRNCLEWQQLTSGTIPIEDIYKVVYIMSLEDYEAICDNRDKTYENKFVEWITKKDVAILDFMLLAKTNEYIRLNHNSRWYYPSMKVGARMTLEEVAEKALSVDDKRLRDRYLLQSVRALFTLRQYNECVALWENEAKHLPEDNLMRQLIQPYAAGSEFRVKRSEKAIEYFALNGDIQSMLFCVEQTGKQLTDVEGLELVCQYAPDSRYIPQKLQELVKEFEPSLYFNNKRKFKETEEFNDLYALCMKMGKKNNHAMWYYTAAYLADMKGETKQASYLLSLAESHPTTEFLKESIKVLRIYLDAKIQPYNEAYEKRLFAQLKWLDKKIEDNIDASVEEHVMNRYSLYSLMSFYYWNDVTRRILLTEVCPRMIQTGKPVRALQLANMADNRLLNLVDKQVVDHWEELCTTCENPLGALTMEEDIENWKLTFDTISIKEYRYSDNYNPYDYSNHFFEMIDSLEVDVAVKYVDNVKNSCKAFDRFLNQRGYVGYDYLYDIVGTKYLRNMQYAEAMQYLGRVSNGYNDHLNVELYCEPFEMYYTQTVSKRGFRYDFAREMYSLEQAIERTSDPDRKARYMIKYAIGLRNSFDMCWELTQYYRGEEIWGRVCEKRDWISDEYSIAARIMTEYVITHACQIASDDVASEIQYAFHNYKTVAKRYPNTSKGKLVRGRCDKLIDYHVERY